MTPDRYRLIRTIATGGMAHVYEAIAQGKAGFERRVALKRILPELAHDESLKRMFLDEARIASHLHHGNIVQVIDYGEVDETEFIAMEYIDGVDAERAVSGSRQRGQRISEALALHVASEVAHALAHAHARVDGAGESLAIVHRDVSPHNVLLSWDGDVKLADFGIAKASMREERTQTGIVKGKLAYMAPEQAMGGDVGPPADVYSLGATLHAILNGAPKGTDAGPDTASPEVARLIADCMKDDQSARPDAEEVAMRAGTLANALLERDARGALRDWLAPLRVQGKVSALDDLMGLCLMSSEEGSERRFTVARLGQAEAAAASPGPVEPRDSRVPTEAATPARRELERAARTDTSVELPVERRPWLMAAVLLVSAAAAAGAFVVWSGASNDESSEVEVPSPVDPTVATPTGDEAEAPPEAEPADVEAADLPRGIEADEAAEAVAGPVRMRRRPREREREPSARMETPSPPVEPAPEPTMAAATSAFLRIPRRGTGQERVLVDGRQRGFTPRVVELESGAHRVVIRDAATEEVRFDDSVVLAPHHTRTSPFVLSR